ncbi:hypothetical protein PHYSODRAFT_321302 [Phytophthora sojae]|uniref:Uncharacterized protein n=1 Tax=Phytophthora sojae (strain P6497) TaxID=1094619 RepID=G4YIB7_PHYSP|nr:hypothetical protein PHYSODRAFT_321302 [Phytophthora sojae]EGZ27500.1 hypothetical protein PHYSODRAFT_321302 [Phytophthora sojae]|eukprot:XP_009514775.1 hypothetical protein PHYSODRAFT_321302 [Phytophthora sojae]
MASESTRSAMRQQTQTPHCRARVVPAPWWIQAALGIHPWSAASAVHKAPASEEQTPSLALLQLFSWHHPAFLNLVAWLPPTEQLGNFKAIERDIGCTLSLRWSSRLIDMDILQCDD